MFGDLQLRLEGSPSVLLRGDWRQRYKGTLLLVCQHCIRISRHYCMSKRDATRERRLAAAVAAILDAILAAVRS